MHDGFEAEVDWRLAGQMQHGKNIIWWTISNSNLRGLGMICAFKQFITHSQVNAHAHTHSHTARLYIFPSRITPFHPENRLPLCVFAIHLCLNTFTLKQPVQTWQPVDSCGLQSNTGSGKVFSNSKTRGQRPFLVLKVPFFQALKTLLFDILSARHKFILSCTIVLLLSFQD